MKLLTLNAHLIWHGVVLSLNHHSEENQFLLTLMLISLLRFKIARDNQDGLNNTNNQELLHFNQEDASISILMKERTPITILFCLLMPKIILQAGQEDILSLSTKSMMTLLNNGSSMSKPETSITMQPQIISFKMIRENFKLLKLVTVMEELILSSHIKPIPGTGMELPSNSKLRSETILMLLVFSTHQNQTSMLKLELTA